MFLVSQPVILLFIYVVLKSKLIPARLHDTDILMPLLSGQFGAVFVRRPLAETPPRWVKPLPGQMGKPLPRTWEQPGAGQEDRWRSTL